MSFIAKVLHHSEGLALSAAYYHLSDNIQAYDNQAKKNRQLQREQIKQRIALLIEEGGNTGQIANDWNIPLRIINKIYTT